jgi:hypothetical protein
MGMRNALAQALEADIFIEGAGGPKRAEFDRVRREQGVKAALAWRDGAGQLSFSGDSRAGRWSRLVGARASSNHRRSWAF